MTAVSPSALRVTRPSWLTTANSGRWSAKRASCETSRVEPSEKVAVTLIWNRSAGSTPRSASSGLPTVSLVKVGSLGVSARQTGLNPAKAGCGIRASLPCEAAAALMGNGCRGFAQDEAGFRVEAIDPAGELIVRQNEVIPVRRLPPEGEFEAAFAGEIAMACAGGASGFGQNRHHVTPGRRLPRPREANGTPATRAIKAAHRKKGIGSRDRKRGGGRFILPGSLARALAAGFESGRGDERQARENRRRCSKYETSAIIIAACGEASAFFVVGQRVEPPLLPPLKERNGLWPSALMNRTELSLQQISMPFSVTFIRSGSVSNFIMMGNGFLPVFSGSSMSQTRSLSDQRQMEKNALAVRRKGGVR